MSLPDKRIIRFIKQHHIFTLATSEKNKPYCCTCFYAYAEEKNLFIFTSDEDTRHINEIRINNCTAGAIALETSVVGKIRGIQFTGYTELIGEDELTFARKTYIKRFPFARLVRLNLWKLQPDFIKMTDNRLGFGTKLIWTKENVQKQPFL